MEPRTTSRVTRKVALLAPLGKIHDTKAAWRRFRRACAESDTAVGMLAKDAPPTWTDDGGREWKTPQILGRLKPGKCSGHAALRDFVIRRDGGECQWCAATDVMLVADHIISRRNGGAHHPDNLRTLCDPCNAAKAGLIDARREAVA